MRWKLICPALATAAAALSGCITREYTPSATTDDDAQVRFASAGEYSGTGEIPPYLSGITWCGGTNFCAVADRGGRLHRLCVALDENGRAKKPEFGESITLEGAADLEGAAFDPLRNTIWVADEKGPKISEHDLETGKRLADLEIPAHLEMCRPNLSTESLAISPDGLSMWTANEEALVCDGPIADDKKGSTVRIFAFRRKDALSPWIPAGEWAYVTDPMGGCPFKGYRRSAVADLAADLNGTLYALEIELSRKILPGFRTRIYAIDFSGADDTTALASLEGAAFRPVGKTLVYESFQIFEMFEGLAFGPPLPGGGRLAVMVSDGDNTLAKSVRYLRAP